jgi:hypothetical protein
LMSVIGTKQTFSSFDWGWMMIAVCDTPSFSCSLNR